MNKGQLIEAVQKSVPDELPKAVVGRVIEAFLTTVQKGVKKDPVQLVGFGTFSTSRRKARKGRNPQTGEDIKIKAKTVVKFKVSKAWKV